MHSSRFPHWHAHIYVYTRGCTIRVWDINTNINLHLCVLPPRLSYIISLPCSNPNSIWQRINWEGPNFNLVEQPDLCANIVKKKTINTRKWCLHRPHTWIRIKLPLIVLVVKNEIIPTNYNFPGDDELHNRDPKYYYHSFFHWNP